MVYLALFSYIYHKNQPNVGKYTIHGSYGYSTMDFVNGPCLPCFLLDNTLKKNTTISTPWLVRASRVRLQLVTRRGFWGVPSWCRILPKNPRHPVLKMTIDVTKLNGSQSITTKKPDINLQKTSLLGWEHLEDYTCTEFTDETPISVNSSNLSEQNLGGTWTWLKIQMLLSQGFL